MGVLDLVAYGENFLVGMNSTELAMPHEKYRYILDDDDPLIF